ncbi:MAG: hypothetical protein OXC63_12480 [Aestuariivita sp.]|nr:hypothetical protein [Aestuariivita sp.]MCY4345209.1 hypothetical protein [Aestuariivita sp.]
MDPTPDDRALSHRINLLEVRMETMNERYDKGWMELRKEMAQRDKSNIQWTDGLVLLPS